MNGEKPNPPTAAMWFLRHARPGGDNDALTGDLIERFREGQTRGWFWRQVLIAFAVRVRGAIWSHWPHICYAVAGTAAICFFRDAAALRGVPFWFHWRERPWPWSQLYFELSRTALLAFVALSVLAVGLTVERSLRWESLLRTGAINLALIALGHYSQFLPWLYGPIPRHHHSKLLIAPPLAQVLLFFSTFLIAAWLGCLSPQQSSEAAQK
jgi:hypothetical protein